MNPAWVVAAIAGAGIVFQAGISVALLTLTRQEVAKLAMRVDGCSIESSKIDRRVDGHEWRITDHDKRHNISDQRLNHHDELLLTMSKSNKPIN